MKRFHCCRDVLISTLSFALLLASATAQANDPANGAAQPAPKAEQQLSALNPDTLNSAMRSLLTATITRDLQGTLKYVAPRKIQKLQQPWESRSKKHSLNWCASAKPSISATASRFGLAPMT